MKNNTSLNYLYIDGKIDVSAGGSRILKEVSLIDPIRYSLNDPIENWLNDLLLLNVYKSNKIITSYQRLLMHRD